MLNNEILIEKHKNKLDLITIKLNSTDISLFLNPILINNIIKLKNLFLKTQN